MGIAIAAICVLGIGLTAIWFSPFRSVALQSFPLLYRFGFFCRVTVLTDEHAPASESEFLCIQMAGRIAASVDPFETDVSLQIEDITAGTFHPEQVLSVDPAYRRGEDPVLNFRLHNGAVSKKNAVLSQWVTVVRIPCHVLRFAYRGRRKLRCKLSILAAGTDQVAAVNQHVFEYVYCAEGYRQIQRRKMEVLKASMQLAMVTMDSDTCDDESVRCLFVQWLEQLSQNFTAATELLPLIDALCRDAQALTSQQAAEPLLAFGEYPDRQSAFELVLRVLAAGEQITQSMSQMLCQVAQILGVNHGRFLVLCQKHLLREGCRIEDPGFLLGVDRSMDQQTFRTRLNEQYRKWNGRVTHPDKQIRQQADRILTLIAELRTLQAAGCV